MKQSIPQLLGLLMAGNGWAQGTVAFRNDAGVVGGNHLVYADYVGGTKLVGTNYVAELYYGPDGAPASSLVPLPNSISPFRAPTTPAPGTWSGVNNLALPVGGIAVPITLEVRVWDISQSSSFEVAAAGAGDLGRFGESGPFVYIQISSGVPTQTDTQMVNLPAFALVPEPTRIALAMVGATGLLLFWPRPKHRRPEP
jgi:hypothetical protein